MEIYEIYCKDNMDKSGVTKLHVLGQCKESIVKWWKESGRHSILPIQSIKLAIGADINDWEEYA